jgi:RNA polymerase sigma factor (sigma-70 family)
VEPESIEDGGASADIRDPSDWQRLIDAVHPAAMLFRIESRMSPALRARVSSEDIWQETLLCAWRDRERLEWRGLPAFRQWLIGIAENRIRDAVERQTAAKRDASWERPMATVAAASERSTAGEDLGVPAGEMSPPSFAIHMERAQMIREALDGLPDHYREVLRLRLFEEWDRDQIADHLSLSISAVKHRIRLGAALYRDRLAFLLSSCQSVLAGRHTPGPTVSHDRNDADP